jgi:type II secretory pathway component HofQ
MRVALAVLVLCACGGSRAVDDTVPDDLELDRGLARRSPSGVDAPTTTPPEPETAVKVDVVDDAPPDTGGPRIDLAVRDADVADVLRMIAVVAEVSLVVSDDVRARVTLEVRHVTWRQAIDVIAHLEGLEVTEEGGIVLVKRAAKVP